MLYIVLKIPTWQKMFLKPVEMFQYYYSQNGQMYVDAIMTIMTTMLIEAEE